MNIDEAKRLVIKAGLKLVESGLIARTWGNVSCRIDDDFFVITPSGRDYLSLTPDEIVAVRVSDCSYNGNIKPSSEKGIHAEVYKLYTDINFVIHTHQENASVISAAGLDSMITDDAPDCLGGEVICAAYALSGTEELKENISNALKHSKGKAVIMKNHGTICLGKDYDEAFLVASELEIACHNYIIRQYFKLSGKDSYNYDEMSDFALSLHYDVEKADTGFWYKYSDSKRTDNGFVFYYNDVEKEIQCDETELAITEETEINNEIYNKYKDINYVIFKTTPEIKAICRYGIEISPLLDDFAQIAGIVVKNIENDPVKIAQALEDSSAVLVKNRGALCCGKTKEDAIAIGMIIQKNCKAYIGASLFGKIKPINSSECIFMRNIYISEYSKLL